MIFQMALLFVPWMLLVYIPHIPHDKGLELAKLILENNFFEFDNKIYRQKLGTAIGTRFAPSFANMFMSKLEQKMLQEYHLNLWIWLRFLDDVLELLELLNYVNSYHDTIKYTWEWS